MSTTGGQLYFTALRTLQRLDIQYVPTQLSFSRTPIISGVAVVGRNNPIHHYVGGTTEMNLELDFHSEDESREDVIRKCKWLESLAYSDGFENPPERVRLTFGRLFQNNEVWIVKSVKYDLSVFQAVHGFLPKQAYVKVSLALDTQFNLRTRDVLWN